MIFEILFAIPVFIIIWYFIFKIKLMLSMKNLTKNILEKLEKQEEKFYDGKKEVKIKELLEEKETEVSDPIVPEVEEEQATTNKPKTKTFRDKDEFKLGDKLE